MPLHLLGKKSWNVYNPANIDRVRLDEAEARRCEEERERRDRADEASTRLEILRGGRNQTLPSREDGSEDVCSSSSRSRKRKLPGEDDTDRDIRLAQNITRGEATSTKRRPQKEDSIIDKKGNISLIPPPEPSEEVGEHQKPRLEGEKSAVYLSHATGRSDSGKRPWYDAAPNPDANDAPYSKGRWGDDSPRRHEREAARLSASDPLAAMKKGVQQLREAEKHKREWKEQRERDLREVEDLAKAQEMKRRREGKGESRDSGHRRRWERRRDDREADLESLDGFGLDNGYTKSRGHDHVSREDRSRRQNRDGKDGFSNEDRRRHSDMDNHRRSRRRSHRHRSRSHSPQPLRLESSSIDKSAPASKLAPGYD